MKLTTFATIACTLSSCLALSALGEETFEVTPDVVYAERDDLQLKLDIYQPRQLKADPAQRQPAILVVHGGAWRRGNRKQLASYATALCNRGYVCFAIDYRLAPDHKFPAQIDDCRDAVLFIRDNAETYCVDPARVGAVGYSAGGHLVSLLATTGEEGDAGNTRLQAAVAGGAPTEFRFLPDSGRGLPYWLGEAGDGNESHQLASPTAHASEDDCPVFFFNGDADALVPPRWSELLFTSLKNAGVTTVMHTIPDAGHMQAALDADALTAAWTFFDEHLQPPAE